MFVIANFITIEIPVSKNKLMAYAFYTNSITTVSGSFLTDQDVDKPSIYQGT